MNIKYFIKNYIGTCSINYLRSHCVTFIRKYEYIETLKNIMFPLAVIIPFKFKNYNIDYIPDNVRFFYSNNVDFDFTHIHNAFYKNGITPTLYIPPTTKIHETVILNVEGIKTVFGKDNKKIQFIHTGGVRIGADVEIGAYTVIHRACMDMTVIKQGVKIGAHCNIGHNNIIGENTVFAAFVILSGSVIIGKNCWLGSGCVIRNGITICDNVVIGTGAVVIKDITKPGIYAGNPAKYIKEKPDDWNF